MTFVYSNELEFILCYTCQGVRNSNKGFEEDKLEILLARVGGLPGSGNLRRIDFDNLNLFQS